MSIQELFGLDGQVVIVTGGGSGLGRAMAEVCGAAGAHVVAADRNLSTAEETVSRIRDAGGAAAAAEVDVADEGSVAALVEGTVAAHGRLDVLFANAGISGYYRRIDEMDLAQWRRVLDVNLTGVMLCAKYASRPMIAARRGKIIITASIWGLVGSNALPIADYAATKGAVVNLTRELALELAEFGVTVNAIAPGFFNTNLGKDKEIDPAIKQRLREESVKIIPTHRRGEADEMRGPALFLASPASDLLNGHILVVDQGVVAH